MRKVRMSYIISVLLTALLIAWFNDLGDIFPVSFIIMFFLTIIFSIVFTLSQRLVKEIIVDIDWSNNKIIKMIKSIQERVYGISDIHFFLLTFIGLIICYLPSYIALFPGTFGYDGPVQMAQYYGDAALSSHHPLAHTYFMGFFFDLGKYVFKSYTVGFAMYIAIQGIVVMASISYSLLFCKKHKVSLIWIAISTLYLIVNPFTQMITFNSTKDVLFAGFLLFFGTEYAYAVLDRKVHVIRLITFGILMCLFRNQGIYMVIVLILLGMLLCMKEKKIYISLLVIIGVSQLFFSLTTYGLKIPKGDAREMLCVPMNQMAYVANEFGYRLTEEEWLLIEEVISADGVAAYTPSSADSVKSYFHTADLLDNLDEHILNYIKIGFRYSKEYKQAWEWLIEGYWKTEVNSYRGLALEYTFKETNRWEIERAGLLPSQFHRLLAATQGYELKLWQRPEMFLWLFVAILFESISKKKKRKIVIILPFLLYFGTVLLGPVALVRYIYPLIISTPLLTGVLFLNSK